MARGSRVSPNASQCRFLMFRTAADSKLMNVNGAVTPVDFSVNADSNERLYLNRINMLMVNNSIGADGFAGLAALTNGLLIKAYDSDGTTVLLDFLEGETIQEHIDFTLLAGVDVNTLEAANPDGISIRWTLRNGLSNMPLVLGPAQEVRITVQDDLSSLNKFTAMAQGHTG